MDLWGGWADAARTRRWREDTLVNAFSVGKALASLCVLMQVSRGLLELDEPVSARWPQFAAAGKDGVTVREVLSHSAGLAAISRDMPEGALYDQARMAAALAEQAPWWAPGSAHGYHVHTFGFLAAELLARASGDRIGSFLRREVSERLGASVSFGLGREHAARCAEYVFTPPRAGAGPEREQRRPSALRLQAYRNPPGATGVGTVNTQRWRDAELPSANLHSDARGIARVYGALAAGGGGLVSEEVLAEATREASAGEDLVLERPSRFGLGFQLSQRERPLGPDGHGFGHFGAGGAVGFCDPQAGLAFAYVTNRGGPQRQDPRNRALIDAAYEGCAGT